MILKFKRFVNLFLYLIDNKVFQSNDIKKIYQVLSHTDVLKFNDLLQNLYFKI